jgi:hypothetical protein
MSDDKRRDDYDVELGEKSDKGFDAPPSPPQIRYTPAPSSSISNNPIIPILSYCASSILMTVTNKYVLSGTDYNLNFFLLCVQVRIPPAQAAKMLTNIVPSRLCALLQFSHASRQESSRIEISEQMKQRNVRQLIVHSCIYMS